MINYDIHKGKNKKGKGSKWSLHILLTATFLLMWNFLAHYNFDLRFHTSAEAYNIPKGMKSMSCWCVYGTYGSTMLFVPLCYNKITIQRYHFTKWFLITHSWFNWNWLWAEAGEKPGGKPLGAKDCGEKQQQFKPPMARPRRQYLNPVYICGRRVLSPLRTPCFP